MSCSCFKFQRSVNSVTNPSWVFSSSKVLPLLVGWVDGVCFLVSPLWRLFAVPDNHSGFDLCSLLRTWLFSYYESNLKWTGVCTWVQNNLKGLFFGTAVIVERLLTGEQPPGLVQRKFVEKKIKIMSKWIQQIHFSWRWGKLQRQALIITSNTFHLVAGRLINY